MLPVGLPTVSALASANTWPTLHRAVETPQEPPRQDGGGPCAPPGLDTRRAHLPTTHVHLLSVDVEDAYLDVLRSNDWDSYRPTVVIVEEDNDSPSDYLRSLGYQVVAGLPVVSGKVQNRVLPSASIGLTWTAFASMQSGMEPATTKASRPVRASAGTASGPGVACGPRTKAGVSRSMTTDARSSATLCSGRCAVVERREPDDEEELAQRCKKGRLLATKAGDVELSRASRPADPDICCYNANWYQRSTNVSAPSTSSVHGRGLTPLIAFNCPSLGVTAKPSILVTSAQSRR